MRVSQAMTCDVSVARPEHNQGGEERGRGM